MMGGGEFIVNGAERVIVSQLHRSPGVDFSIVSSEGDRPLHSARIIPERGSWIELEVTKKDVLAMRIDQSTKLAATTFLRCLDESVEVHRPMPARPVLRGERDQGREDVRSPSTGPPSRIIDKETGEELVHVGRQIGDSPRSWRQQPQEGPVIQNPSDVLILNTIAEEKLEQFEATATTSGRCSRSTASCARATRRRSRRPSSSSREVLRREPLPPRARRPVPHQPQVRAEHARGHDVHPQRGLPAGRPVPAGPAVQPPGPETGRPVAQVDDIDHLGNRRLRTLDELAVEELRKGFLKLRARCRSA
jgi:DNA-directed RNA polymerase subunit beta